MTELSRPRVVLTGPIHPEAIAHLMDSCDVDLLTDASPVSLKRALARADAVILRANAVIDAAVLATATKLKVIGRHGVGIDNIDLEAARAADVLVVHTPEANANSVAEHAFAGLLTLAKHLDRDRAALARGDWTVRASSDRVELFGRRLGIVGFGRIGRRLAEIASAGFGMDVAYHDPHLRATQGHRSTDLDEILTESDVVSVHVPALASTRGLIDADALGRMRRRCLLVNTSRGGVIDEAALAKSLRDGLIAGAVLDVFDDEPLPTPHPLHSAPNVVLTPHTAALTEEAGRRMSGVANDVLRVLRGEPPRWPVAVNPVEAGDRSTA